MKLQMEIAIAGALLGSGCVAACLGLWRALRHAAQRQQQAEQDLAKLAGVVKLLEARLADLASSVRPAQEAESMAAVAEGAGMEKLNDSKPETLAVLTAAATAFLGRAAGIRSARLIANPAEHVSPWSQQGRVIVQTSHNLRPRD